MTGNGNPVGAYEYKFYSDEDQADQNAYLNFEGVDSCIYLWLNGEFVGYSSVSHVTHEFDISDYIQSGENLLQALVFKWSAGSYLEDQDKFRMSGIFRDVYILYRPETHIVDYVINHELNDSLDKAEIQVDLEWNEEAEKSIIDSAIIEVVNPRNDELIKEFSFERVSKTGGIFDKDKLDWVNAQFLRNQDINVLREEASEELIKAGLITEDFAKENKEYMEVLIDTLKDNISLMTELPEKARFIFEELPLADETKEFLEGDNAENAKVLANAIEEELASVDEITLDYAKTFMKSIQKKTGIKGKNLYMPVRAMISFSVHGPEMDRILYLLGKEKIFKRLDKFK